MEKAESFIDCVAHRGQIHTWVRTFDGRMDHKKCDVGDYTYLFIPDNTGNPTHKNIYGVGMKKVSFDTPSDMRKYVESHDNTHESDIAPNYKLLLEKFHDTDYSSPYNLLYFDIEVDFDLEDGNGYPKPSNPFGQINSISCYDKKNDQYVMFIPKKHEGKIRLKDTRHKTPISVYWTRDETDMLLSFSSFIKHVDVLTSWNGDSFDIPYIMERAMLLLPEEQALTLLTRNKVPAYRREYINEYGEESIEWKLAGRVHLDMMQVAKKFEPGEKKSFALDSICQEYLGESKISFEDDLGSLYRENPQLFYEYSLHDARLIRMLDEKKSYIALAVLTTRSACSRFTDVTGSVKLLDQDFIKYCRSKGNIVVPDLHDNSKTKFDGAVVFDTVTGRHENVFSTDVASMYPHCIMLLGLSPETILYQCEGEYDDFVHITTQENRFGMVTLTDYRTGVKHQMMPTEIYRMIKENGYTISGNGTIFTGKMGLFAQYMFDGFAERARYKKLMSEAYGNGDEVLGGMYNLYQGVAKLKLNSFYGITGNENFRFFDLNIAKSITITAQVVAKWQMYQGNQMIKLLVETNG